MVTNDIGIDLGAATVIIYDSQGELLLKFVYLSVFLSFSTIASTVWRCPTIISSFLARVTAV